MGPPTSVLFSVHTSQLTIHNTQAKYWVICRLIILYVSKYRADSVYSVANSKRKEPEPLGSKETEMRGGGVEVQKKTVLSESRTRDLRITPAFGWIIPAYETDALTN